MKTRSRLGIAGASIMSALAVACGGTSTEDASPPHGLSEPTSGESESLRLFSDPSTSGPRLDVYDADGEIAVFVSGPIGTETEVLSGLSPDSSLVEIYQALHPTASEIPSELEALDEVVAPQLRALAASASSEAPTAALVDKSESQFNSTVCKAFAEGNSRYTPVVCKWKAGVNIIRVAQDGSVRAGDRVYGWNNSSTEAKIVFYPCVASAGCPATGVVKLAPFWWTWGSMNGGGPYSANVVATFGILNPDGDRGGTHHVRSSIIR